MTGVASTGSAERQKLGAAPDHDASAGMRGSAADSDHAKELRAMVAALHDRRGNVSGEQIESMVIDSAKGERTAGTAANDHAGSRDRQKDGAAVGHNGSTGTPRSAADRHHANELRAMVAALVNAPKQTPESFREALAASGKEAPGVTRDHDYGAGL